MFVVHLLCTRLCSSSVMKSHFSVGEEADDKQADHAVCQVVISLLEKSEQGRGEHRCPSVYRGGEPEPGCCHFT